MKKLLWTGVLIAALGSSVWAQAQNGYITSPASGNGTTVLVVDAGTLTPIPSTAGAPNPIACGTGATHIIGVPARNKVYVSNFLGASISIIDNATRTVVNTVTFPVGTTVSSFGGMALTQDGNFILIAGRNVTAGEAGVFQLDLNTETLSYLGGILSASFALDCDVVPASVTGGSGNGIGRVYFTVPADNNIGILRIVPSSPSVTQPALAGTSNPTRLERAPDSSMLLVGCTASVSNIRRLIRIVPQVIGDVFDVIQTGAVSGVLPDTVDDVAFRSTPATAPFTFYCVGVDSKNNFMHKMSVSSTLPATDLGETVLASFATEATYDPVGDRLFVADTSGTSNNMSVLNVSTGVSPYPIAVTLFPLTQGPRQVAFLPVTLPSVEYVSPSAGLNTAIPQILIQGSGFSAGAKVQLFDGGFTPTINATTNTVVDANTILATFPTATANILYRVVVNNDDGRQAVLFSYFQSMGAVTPPVPAFTVPLPPASAGYSMLSFPQFATAADLKAALTAQLGPYNPGIYRVFVWDQNGYVELNQLNPLLPYDLMGKGFFAITRLGQTLTLPTNASVTATATATVRAVALSPGWNIVSQPWINGPTSTLPVGSLQLTLTSDLMNPVPAIGSTFIFDTIYEFVGNQYVAATGMTAGKAYWIHNETSGPVYLLFNQVSVAKSIGHPIVAKTSGMAKAPPIPPAPPGAALDTSRSCGFLGADLLLVGLACAGFRRLRRHRRLAA